MTIKKKILLLMIVMKLLFFMFNFLIFIFFVEDYSYRGESKVFQYFSNVRPNSSPPDSFTKIVMVTNHKGL